MPLSQIHTKGQSGFTLIEVMIAALVLAIGILGLTSIILLGLKSDKSAYYRSQASAIAYDIADRMRINNGALNSYIGFDTNNNASGTQSCTTADTGCNAAQQANVDFREWKNNFQNVFNVGSYSPKLPNGRGQVTQDGSGRYIVLITWSEDDWGEENGSLVRKNTPQSLSVTFLTL